MLIRKAISSLLFLLLLAVVILFKPIYAERPPIRIFTSADGLTSSAITHITRDARGFLWFSTRDGLARFDGSEFTNYRLRDQLTAQVLFQVLISQKNVYWVIAADGLYRISREESTATEALSVVQSVDNRQVLNAAKVSNISFNRLYEDRSGRLLAADNRGLFLIEDRGNQEIGIEQIDLGKLPSFGWSTITTITEDEDGSLWFGSPENVFRRLPDGRVYSYPIPKISNRDNVSHLLFDDNGYLWISHSAGLFILKPESIEALSNIQSFSSPPVSLKEVTVQTNKRFSFPENSGQIYKIIFEDSITDGDSMGVQADVSGLYKASDGKIWFTTRRSLFSFDNRNSEFHKLTNIYNFPLTAQTINEDSTGNIWLGTTGGAFRLKRQGLTTYAQNDGLKMPNISSIYESKEGDLWVVHDNFAISRFNGTSFERRQLPLPADSRIIWASTGALLDSRGDWWALAENGLYQFSDYKLKKKYTQADGLKSNSFFCAYEDKKGNLWFSTRRTNEENGLLRIDAETGTIRLFSEAEGFPKGKSASSFVEDNDGNIWIGFYESGLVRYRNNRFDVFTAEDGIPTTSSIPSLHIDQRGRLWIASGSEGVLLLEDTTREKAVFRRFSLADGLVSNGIRRIIEDPQGNIYLGTTRGIDRFNPETKQVKHYTTADGLASDYIAAAFADKNGALWFGTQFGLSRLDPVEDIAQSAPQVFINALQIAGINYKVSEFGQEKIENIDLSAAENNIQFEFVSVGDNLRYQYKLEGAAEDNWSDLVSQRSVNYANLGAGSYRFLVRAVNSAGLSSEAPAVVAFTIHPPFWRTWYFFASVLLAVAVGVFALDRYRVAKTRQVKNALEDVKRTKEDRLRDLEKVRTRIANDLHDDIGASLTQITILSEVVRSQFAASEDNAPAHLDRISEISNELVETMSDIVWAINPRKDHLRDLIKRMRRFAADVLSARQIKFEFTTPSLEDDHKIGANIRREIFAIYKESINNAVKHSKCTRVEAILEIDGDYLKLAVSDNGTGFDIERSIHESYASGLGGNGLNNIQRRGAELRGICEVISFIGGGTTILLEIPLSQSDN